jgi:hypothetical protein
VIFIDTGAFLGRYDERDPFHSRADRGWKRLDDEKLRCFTSSFVLDETFTLLARRVTYEYAADKADTILGSKVLRILRPTAEDEFEAVRLFRKYADRRVSFTDCISFVLMRRQRLRKAFAYDVHFERAGFELWPPRD